MKNSSASIMPPLKDFAGGTNFSTPDFMKMPEEEDEEE